MLHRPAARALRAGLLCCLAWTVEGAAPSTAQERPPAAAVERITLADALARLERGSPELRVAAAEVDAARARVVTAGTRPNPTVSLDREQLGGGESYHETVLAVAQPLDLAGQRGARRAAAEREVGAAEARGSAERFRLASAVRRAYLGAAGAEARLATLSAAAEVFRDVETAGARRHREGDISDFELQRLQVEAARYEVLVEEARLEVSTAGRALGRLVGAPDVVLPAERLDALSSGAAEIPLDAALARVAARPDVRAADAELEAARAQVDARRRGARPNPTVSGGLKEQAGGTRGAVIGVSMPLPVSDRGRGAVAEAEALLAGAEARRAVALRDAEAEVRAAWERRRSLAARVTLRAGLLARADALLRTARVAYSEGEMTLIELLDAAEAYHTARESATTLLADYLQSAAELDRATGGPDR